MEQVAKLTQQDKSYVITASVIEGEAERSKVDGFLSVKGADSVSSTVRDMGANKNS